MSETQESPPQEPSQVPVVEQRRRTAHTTRPRRRPACAHANDHPTRGTTTGEAERSPAIGVAVPQSDPLADGCAVCQATVMGELLVRSEGLTELGA